MKMRSVLISAILVAGCGHRPVKRPFDSASWKKGQSRNEMAASAEDSVNGKQLSKEKILGLFGVPQKSLPANAVFGPASDEAEFLYYDLPMTKEDFDCRYFVIAIDSGGNAKRAFVFSN